MAKECAFIAPILNCACLPPREKPERREAEGKIATPLQQKDAEREQKRREQQRYNFAAPLRRRLSGDLSEEDARKATAVQRHDGQEIEKRQQGIEPAEQIERFRAPTTVRRRAQTLPPSARMAA